MDNEAESKKLSGKQTNKQTRDAKWNSRMAKQYYLEMDESAIWNELEDSCSILGLNFAILIFLKIWFKSLIVFPLE